MKKTALFFISALSLSYLTIDANSKKPQTKCPIPTSDQLITSGSSNICAGFYKVFPHITHKEMLSASTFSYATTQAAIGTSQMLIGAMQLAIGKSSQIAYNHPQETIAAIVIPTMIKCLHHQSQDFKF